MGNNQFGKLFQITTWGESHGKGYGVVIDGCPAGLAISEEEINTELRWRQPGKTPYVTTRQEPDLAQIFSGVFEGKTTGAPLCIVIMNTDADSSKYEPIKDLLRPGHANFTYLEKYGIFDYRGGGRASARETLCRVAAGAVAKKLLKHFGIQTHAYIHAIGGIALPSNFQAKPETIHSQTYLSPIFCPDHSTTELIIAAIEKVKNEGDSLGGIVESVSFGLPVGLGDPVYEKLEANLAKAMLTIPASKGFEIGAGFKAAEMKGSEHNDAFTTDTMGQIITTSNHAGGTLGGISTGMPLITRVAFKPTSSIAKLQHTTDLYGIGRDFQIPEGSRHDPCVTIRAVPVVEAMTALVLVDALLLQRTAQINEKTYQSSDLQNPLNLEQCTSSH